VSSALSLSAIPSTLFTEGEWQQVQNTVARLNEPQLFWLSGYLAGAAKAQPNAAVVTGAAATPSPAEPPILIAYGGETGNSKTLAGKLLQLAQSASIPARMEDLAKIRVRQLAKERKLLIICSTHGDGDPPETISQFHEDLAHVAPDSLKQLQYAVLALGDSSYEKFCQTGKDIDHYLEQAGAIRLQPREECDVDFAVPAGIWMKSLVTSLEKDRVSTGAPAATAAPANENTVPAFSKNHPCIATVLDSICLSHPSRHEKIWHLELEADERIELQPGDAVGVLPHNSPALVQAIINGAGLDPDRQVLSNGSEKSVFKALQEDCDLVLPTKGLLEKWPQWNLSHTLQNELQDILARDAVSLRQYMKTVQVKDLLQRFPVQPDAADFIAHLRPLQPRLYDVANYPDGNPGEVHLLFKEYRYWFGERIETGIASDYLAQIATGSELRIYPHHSHKFRLDGDSTAPLILLAEGTGIAPYRAFIEKMRAEQNKRQCWVLFQEMQYEQDFLYQSEWQQAVSEQLIGWFDGVFASDEPDKSLLQSVLHQSERFLDLMQQGAHVYLCGDKKILTDCELALGAFYDAHTAKLPGSKGLDWKALGKAGRIHRNLY
jgi:sulfite reductase (NADPH) flavoprotein alpha-component